MSRLETPMTHDELITLMMEEGYTQTEAESMVDDLMDVLSRVTVHDMAGAADD